MGCCQSSNVKSTSHNSSVSNPVVAKKQSIAKAAAGGGQEDKIELAFKAKRANVFSENLMENTTSSSNTKSPKSPEAHAFIKKALASNYIFASLSETDINSLIDSMKQLSVVKGENVITQGAVGDYFYVIDQGTFSIIINGKKVSNISDGMAFGELALVYNSPRQATIMAETNSTLYSLDRSTFRYTLSSSSSQRQQTIKKSLSKVTLLEGLTDEQFDKICDTVELVPFKAGDVIIKKGDVGNIFYMIKEGTVKVGGLGSDMKEITKTAGDYFGEMALLTGEPRAATITAQTPCTLFALDRENFNLLLGPLRDLIDENMSMQVLNSIKIFDKLTKEDKSKIFRSLKLEKYASGQAIIKEGEKGQTFYIIKAGTVKVSLGGNEVKQLGQGTYFGEMALLDDDIRKATCTALTAAECFVLDRESFNRFVSGIHEQMSRETSARLESLKHTGESDLSIGNLTTNYKLADLKTLAVLGSGTFGRVTLVQEAKTKNIYALKTMMKSEVLAQKQQGNILAEKAIMMDANHPFILRLFQTFKDSKRLMMLLEFIQGGELFSVLHTTTGDGVSNVDSKFYSAGIILAVEYLHSKNIAYRDMKPENCLIDKLGYPKVVDFGLAKVIKGKSFTLCGTPEYLAPELVLGRGHSLPVDYWAFGILLYEMQSGYSPFSDPQGNEHVIICKNIVSGKLTFPKNFNPECKDLVKGLLTREVQQRLGNLKAGPKGIINSKWYEGFDWEAYKSKKMTAPWIPNVKSATDTSLFDISMVEDPKDDGFVDVGNWDKDF